MSATPHPDPRVQVLLNKSHEELAEWARKIELALVTSTSKLKQQNASIALLTEQNQGLRQENQGLRDQASYYAVLLQLT